MGAVLVAHTAVASSSCSPQFDVEFPRMPCSWLSLDAMDISGEMHLDVVSCDRGLRTYVLFRQGSCCCAAVAVAAAAPSA